MKPLYKNLLLTFGTFLSCLLTMELGLRVYHAYAKSASAYRHAEHPEMIYEVKPNIYRDCNSRGCRDGEHAIQKAPGASRLLIIGDSVTRGYGVTLQDGIPGYFSSDSIRLAGITRFSILVLIN